VEVLVPAKYRSGQHRETGGLSAASAYPANGMGLDLNDEKKDGTEFPVEISLSR